MLDSSLEAELQLNDKAKFEKNITNIEFIRFEMNFARLSCDVVVYVCVAEVGSKEYCKCLWHVEVVV